MAEYKVVDLSKFNVVSDYNALANDVRGAIIRLGYRGYSASGTLVKDSRFDTHYAGLAGKTKIGVYWFSTAISEAEAVAEANYCHSLLQGKQNDFPVYLDSELSNGGSGRNDGLSYADRTKYAMAWGNRMKELGYRVGLYASQAWFGSKIAYHDFKNAGWSMWIAKYSTAKPTWPNYDGWQYTSGGSVAGIASRVDLSTFYNDVAGWETQAKTNINTLNCHLYPTELEYNGNAQPVFAIIDGLNYPQDYAVEYTNCTNVGTANCRFTGVGNYEGTVDRQYSITAYDVNKLDITSKTASYTYDGKAKKPGITWTKTEGTASNKFTSSQYSISYSNNVNAGTATITVKGKNNFTGTKKAHFTIKALGISKLNPKLSATSFIYTGQPINPTVSFDDSLTLNTDYTVEYSNNVNVGTALATIKGKGNYSGTVKLNYTISSANLSDHTITLSPTNFTYNGQAQTPTITVDGLVEGTHYSVSYTNNVNAGVATATITGIGNIQGTIVKTYNINKAQISSKIITINPTEVEYTGSAITPSVTVSDCTVNKDYTVAYSNNINIGTGNITITGIGNYTGYYNGSFRITQRTLPKNIWSLSAKSYTYDGKVKTPQVICSGSLILNTDYKVEYANNINAGVATVTITGINTYKPESVVLYFDINRLQIDEDCISIESDSFIYTGTEIRPNFIITGAEYDYTYETSYENNVYPGDAVATFIATGNFKGSVSFTFEIHAIDIAQHANIVCGEPNEEGIYDRNNFAVVNKNGGTPLVLDEDYLMWWDYYWYPVNNTYVYSYWVIIGIKGYTGIMANTFLTTIDGYEPVVPHYTHKKSEEDEEEDPVDPEIITPPSGDNPEDLLKYEDDKAYDYGDETSGNYSVIADTHSFGDEDIYFYTGDYYEDRSKSEPEIGYEDELDADFNELCLIETPYTPPPEPEPEPEDQSEFVPDDQVHPIIPNDPNNDDDDKVKFPSGTVVLLKNVVYYSSSYNIYPESNLLLGYYYIYDYHIVNGRIRITKTESNVKIVGNITGWVRVQDIENSLGLHVGIKVNVLDYIWKSMTDDSEGKIYKAGQDMYIVKLVTESSGFEFGSLDEETKIDTTDGYEFGNPDPPGNIETDLIDDEEPEPEPDPEPTDEDSEDGEITIVDNIVATPLEDEYDDDKEYYDFNYLSNDMDVDIGRGIGLANTKNGSVVGWASVDLLKFYF